jgi:hypothetical protein
MGYYEMNCFSPKNSYAGALLPTAAIVGSTYFKEIIKVK